MVSFSKSSVARSFAALALVVSACFAPAIGCGGGEDAGAASEDIQDASIAFEVIDAERQDAEAGLTVLKNTADYKAFFGASPPSSVDFKKHWVLHYSLGEKPTSGFAVEVVAVKATGSKSARTVVVELLETEPAADCVLAQAFETPQVAVRINKQTAKKVIVDAQAELAECSSSEACAGLPCGASCSPCDPGDIDCVAPAVLMFCGADGSCSTDEPSCDGGGGACGDATCGEGEYCCNESCGVCAPFGGACTQEVCEPGGAACGTNTCGAGEYCCNVSCGICAPEGGACSQQECEPQGQPCGSNFCGDGQYCCNDSCGICAPDGGACTQQVCGG
jgi:hypothetical protein